MFLLKICRCCDRIIGELETDDPKTLGVDHSLEVVGNIAYTICTRCWQELDIDTGTFYH